MQKIIFNAQLANTGHRIQTISGRLGNFIFRTYQDGRITAYFKPRKNESITFQCPSIIESLSSQLREIAEELGLSVVSINFDIRHETATAN